MIAAIYADHFSYHYHLSLGTVVVHMLAEHRLKIYKQSQRRFSWKWKKKNENSISIREKPSSEQLATGSACIGLTRVRSTEK